MSQHGKQLAARQPGQVARGDRGSAPAGSHRLLSLQAAAGNRAVAGLLGRRAVQRLADRPGWSDADTGGDGWNAGDHVGWGFHRVPIDDIPLGNQQAFSGDHPGAGPGKVEHGEANERAKTTESAAGRAIVLVPTALRAGTPVKVMLHLHGYTSRGVDPYAGWRQRKGDHTVRDVAQDQIEQQLQTLKDPQLIGILPQGVGHSEFGGLVPAPYVDAVMARLAQVAAHDRIPVPDLTGYQLVLSAHSGGGATVTAALDAEGRKDATGRAGAAPTEVVLFEAIYGGQADSVWRWARRHLDRTLAAVRAASDPAAAARAVAACPTLRAYRGNSPSEVAPHKKLKDHLDGWFGSAAHQRDLGGLWQDLRNHFQVIHMAGVGHEQTVRGGQADPARGALADALSALRDPTRASTLDSDTATPAKTAPAKAAPATPKAAPAPPPVPAATRTAPDPARAKDFLHDVKRTTLELLPAAQRARFEAVEWNPLDFPGAKELIKDPSEENLAAARAEPGITVYSVTDKKGTVRWYKKGSHQAEAQALIDAVVARTSGGGERRPNTGRYAVLTQSQYKRNPADYDAYFIGQLQDVQSYDVGSSTSQHTNRLNKHAAERFPAMLAAAARDGVHLSVNNSFRDRKKAEANAKRADNPNAVAKYSAHSLGLAMDMNLWTAGMGHRSEMGSAMTNIVRMLGSPSYKWLYQHGSDYGFYQYRNEPWHWEYNPPGFQDVFWSDRPELTPAAEPARHR